MWRAFAAGGNAGAGRCLLPADEETVSPVWVCGGHPAAVRGDGARCRLRLVPTGHPVHVALAPCPTGWAVPAVRTFEVWAAAGVPVCHRTERNLDLFLLI